MDIWPLAFDGVTTINLQNYFVVTRITAMNIYGKDLTFFVIVLFASGIKLNLF